MSPTPRPREWALVRATTGFKHDAPCGPRCRWFHTDGRRRRHPRTRVYVRGPGRVHGRHSRCPTGERQHPTSKEGDSDDRNSVNKSKIGGLAEPQNQADLVNEEATPSKNGDVGHGSAAPDTTKETVPHGVFETKSSSLHARGGGLGRLLRQCFGMRSPPSPGPRYVYHEQYVPRRRPQRRPRRRSRPHRRRISSYDYNNSHYRRHDRYHSPSPRRRNGYRPAAPKATREKRSTRPTRPTKQIRRTRPERVAKPLNYDGMGDEELFNTLLAEERAMDPMLRDADARRAHGEDV